MHGADVHVAKHPVVAGWRHSHPWIWIKHGIYKALVCSMGAAVNNFTTMRLTCAGGVGVSMAVPLPSRVVQATAAQ